MTTFDKSAHGTKWIPVKNLSVIWANAQRELDPKRVDRIASEFDPDLFDDLIVTLPNGNGIYHVVDGQHRRAAIQQLYGENETVPCRVIDATDPKRAAAVFVKVNTSRKTPNLIEQFNARVTAGYDNEVHIQCIVDRLGYRVARQQGPGVIQSVGALTGVYKAFGSEVLKETLQTIKATWGDDYNALAANIIKGYGALLGEHRGHIDFKRLRECMAKAMTPGQLVGRARYHAELTKASAAEAVKYVLIHTYNTGIKAGKL